MYIMLTEMPTNLHGAGTGYLMNATQSMVGSHDDSQCPTLLHRAHFACVEVVG